jgi:hypothetical protein
LRRAVSEVLGGEHELACVVVAAQDGRKATRSKTAYEAAIDDPVVHTAVSKLGARIAGFEYERDSERA